MSGGFADSGTAWRPALPGAQTSEADPGAAYPGDNQPPSLPFASTGPHGHRRRMRERVLGVGAATLADYELLEMLLFLGIPRGDTKPLAKALINRFGSLAGVLTASSAAFPRQDGFDDRCAALVRLPELAALRLSGAEARDHPILNNWDRLHEYFHSALTGAIAGQLRILFLDNRNRLLADETIHEPDQPPGPGQPEPARQTMRRALDLHATALILVRIVPSGPIPKAVTCREVTLATRLEKAAAPLAIILHDAMLVGGENWVSLRQKGLI